MAFFTDTNHRDAGMMELATSSLSHWLSGVSETMARRRIARTTYSELASLSDRELADLGMARSQLRRIACEAAQGKL